MSCSSQRPIASSIFDRISFRRQQSDDDANAIGRRRMPTAIYELDAAVDRSVIVVAAEPPPAAVHGRGDAAEKYRCRRSPPGRGVLRIAGVREHQCEKCCTKTENRVERLFRDAAAAEPHAPGDRAARGRRRVHVRGDRLRVQPVRAHSRRRPADHCDAGCGDGRRGRAAGRRRTRAR